MQPIFHLDNETRLYGNLGRVLYLFAEPKSPVIIFQTFEKMLINLQDP